MQAFTKKTPETGYDCQEHIAVDKKGYLCLLSNKAGQVTELVTGQAYSIWRK